MDISNNVLAVLVVAAMAISIASTMSVLSNFQGRLPFEGLFTQTQQSGEANVTLAAEVAIELVNSSVDFGDLSVEESNATSGLNAGGPSPLALRNIGSVDVNVSMAVWASDDLWQEANSPSEYFKFNATSNGSTYALWYGGSDDPDGLTEVPNVTGGNWPDTNPANVAYNLSEKDDEDTLLIELNITAPSGEPAGAKGATLRFQAAIG